MAEVVNKGVIVIDLVSGKVELPAPNLDPVLAARKEELRLVEELRLATERAWQAQEKLNESMNGGRNGPGMPSMPGMPGGGNYPTPVAPMPVSPAPAPVAPPGPAELDSWEKGLAILEQQNDTWNKGIAILGARKAAEAEAAAQSVAAAEESAAAAERQRTANEQVFAAYEKVGAGAFRLARAVVLLGSDSDESFQTMIKGLAYVQAGFDLFKGASQIVKALAAAETALAAATALDTLATAANTTVHNANAAAKARSAAGSTAAALGAQALAVATNPVVVVIAALGAAVMVCVQAWDYFTESEEEAAEAQKLHAQAAKELVAVLQEQARMAREVADIERETMSGADRADSLAASAKRNTTAGRASAIAGGYGDAGEAAYRENAAKSFSAAASDLKAERDLRKQMLDQEIAIRDEKIRQLQTQERIVTAAQKSLDVEKEKVRAFQAQAGSLTKREQQQLIEIRDKLRSGKDISRFEEQLLSDNAGEQGRAIADARRAKRGEAAGFDKDFFKGIEGASTGLDDAAKALKEAVEQLKALTGGATAAAKIAELEQEKAALNAKYQEFLKEFNAAMLQLAEYMKTNNAAIAELLAASLHNSL